LDQKFIQEKETGREQSILLKAILILFSLLINIASAAVINVNQTSILVSDTRNDDSLKLKQAFAQMLAKNTGEGILTILKNPIFNQANIQKGIKRSYHETIDSKYLSSKTHKYWFHLVMQKAYVQNIIKQAGLSLLPHNRKEIMLWAVKQQLPENTLVETPLSNQQSKLMYADDVSLYWIKHWADALGLVLITPEMDARDKRAVSPSTIKSLSYQATQQSKDRYQVDNSLMIYIKKSLDAIKIRSGLSLANNDLRIKYFKQQLNEQNPQPEEGEVLYSAVLDAYEYYANLHKIDYQDLQKHSVRLVIKSIDNYDQVIRIRQYFNNLSVIEAYEIVSATHGELVMNTELSIKNSAFLRMIQRDGLLSFNQNSPINQIWLNLSQFEE
jgi:hypothetical protein